MEIVEIISFHLNNLENVLEISFRTNDDYEDTVRESLIDYSDISDFGYEFHLSESDDFLLEEEGLDDDLFVDEIEILSFLNEYYVLFIDKLPKATSI
jgi:hypothetical protein